MTDDPHGTFVAPAANRARNARGHRAIWIAAAVMAIGIFGLAGLFALRSSAQQSEIDAQQAHIGQLSDAAVQQHNVAQQLYDQVNRLGGTPSVQPLAVTGVAGPQGIQGLKGDQGLPGKDGQSPPCLSTPTQCQGADGKDGAPGTPGVDGVDGKDGATGQPGKDGANGATGSQGPPGPTCPDGYAPGPAIIVSPDGSTHQGLACIQNAPPTSSTKASKG